MEDRTLLSTFLVNTTADSGAGSLRQAILDSNAATGGTSTIDFDIPGQEARIISPLSPLPAITGSVLIDGFSQPGYSGTPLIELSGGGPGIINGLTITGSDVTIRGLDINGFTEGAGILISGPSATSNLIETNDIGTDPTGSQANPNGFGVEILNGASDNTIGGTSAAAGNLVAFNSAPGVDVEGAGSLGNQITANRIFANDDSSSPSPIGAIQFDGSNYVSLPNGLVDGSEPSETLEARFQTTSGGVILGYQAASPGTVPNGWVPTLYVGTDGKLYGGSYDATLGAIEQVISNGAVNDGVWHNVALVIDGSAGTMTLYLDGQLVGTVSGSPQYLADSFNQIGTGFTEYWPAATAGWYGFVGQIDDVRVWSEALSAGEISQDISTPPAGTAQGLEADYPLNDAQGQTAFDLTPNQNNGTLAALNGGLPVWYNGSGEAIDLGGDGITYNSDAPRQGPNNFQNFPVVVTTALGGLEGGLSGGTPETTYRIDLFASAGYSPQGAGQAQDYLGSLDVTTDSQGQAVFDVPFTSPAGLPVVTATATDAHGNTSEVSALRRAGLRVAGGLCSRCCRSAAALLGRNGRCHRIARPGCRTARPGMERDPFGDGWIADALERERPGGHGQRHGHAAIPRISLGSERSTRGYELFAGAGYPRLLHAEPERRFRRRAGPRGQGKHHRRILPGHQHGRQRPRLATAGDPRFQHGVRRDEHD